MFEARLSPRFLQRMDPADRKTCADRLGTALPRLPGRPAPGIALLTLALLAAALAGCARKVQPATDRFAMAITTTTRAEDALFAAIGTRRTSAERFCLALTKHIRIPDRRIEPVNSRCAPPGAGQGQDGIASARRAVDTVLAPLDAYAEALRALAGSTASTTLDSNIDRLSKSVTAFDSSVLTPLGAAPGVSQAMVSRIGKAARQIGDALITIETARDVNAAARAVSKPLARIAAGLRRINRAWTATIPGDLTAYIKGNVIALWPQGSYTDRQALYDAWQKAAQPIPPKPADDALASLVTANDAVAEAGPVAAATRIEHALGTASSAHALYAVITAR